MPMIFVNCDGCCEPTNPRGYACWAWVARESGDILALDYGLIAQGKLATNNIAEYAAVLNALQHIKDHWLGDDVCINTDSQLVVKQVLGEWACNAPNLQPYKQQCQDLLKQLGDGVILDWCPRTENEEADSLTRLAYRLSKGNQIDNIPEIKEYRHIFNMFRSAKTNEDLDYFRTLFIYNVPKYHTEFNLLVEAGKQQRRLLNSKTLAAR